jgi:hypothetical protein
MTVPTNTMPIMVVAPSRRKERAMTEKPQNWQQVRAKSNGARAAIRSAISIQRRPRSGPTTRRRDALRIRWRRIRTRRRSGPSRSVSQGIDHAGNGGRRFETQGNGVGRAPYKNARPPGLTRQADSRLKKTGCQGYSARSLIPVPSTRLRAVPTLNRSALLQCVLGPHRTPVAVTAVVLRWSDGR